MPTPSEQETKFTWLIIACVFVGIFEILSLFGIHLREELAIPLFASIILLVGHYTLIEGLKALFALNFKSIHLLMLIAVAGAFYLKRYEEAAVIIVLYTLAERLELFGIAKSQSALQRLVQQMPKFVTLKEGLKQVPVSEVELGEILVFKPFEMIALDGEVVDGFSYVDESTMTGEPLPQDKSVGDQVFAGTFNKQGSLEIRVTKLAEDSTFAKIQSITSQALEHKAETQQFIETFSQFYTPAILMLAIGWLALHLFWGAPFNSAFLNALTLIVIACPCALVISTPISIYSAIGNASLQGILIKGGRYLEAIGRIKAMALDKTRTLTYGQPLVTDIIPFNGYDNEELLSCAAGLELLSEHPLAQGVLAAAQKAKYTPHSVSNFESVVGKGAKADCLICHDRHHCIGKLSFILEEHTVPQQVINEVARLEEQGKTAIVVSTHKEVEGVIALSDEIRPESQTLIQGLNQLGITPALLTGDHPVPAHQLAQQLGIQEVHAQLLPEDKATVIKSLIKKYKDVAMVGDGINDAPALALAQVGITLGSLGNDIAIETASIVMLNDRLDLIPFLIRLGRETVKKIKWNTFWAIAVKLLFISLALIGMGNLVLAIFADVGVTLLVILNSLRLMKYH